MFYFAILVEIIFAASLMYQDSPAVDKGVEGEELGKSKIV
jgi:hypothetical protein